MKTLARQPAAILAETAAWLLVFLFAYTAVSKVYDWQGTRMAMYNQIFPNWMAEALLYVLPLTEIGLAVLLLVPSRRKLGLLLSVVLLSLFTGYVAVVWLGFTARVPCSCGGVLSSLGWGAHLVFNLVCLGVSCTGYWLSTHPKRPE